ncbi:MAG: hypothetical protein WBX03_02510 [Terriglobales bacterium]|jgi:hypothetical protein
MRPAAYSEFSSTPAPRRSMQVLPGALIAGFTVIAGEPERINGVLCWTCTCLHDHTVPVPHAELSAGHAVCNRCAAELKKKARGIGETDQQFNDWAALHRVPRRKRPVPDTPEQAA